MKLKMFIAILIATASVTQGAILDIYADDTIQNGDVYDTVNIYDSLDVPPVQTTVDMTGGDISYLNVYDTANFNCYDGDLSFLYVYENAAATINNLNYIASIELHNNASLYMHGGVSSVSIQIFDDAELHVYGYDFEYDPSIIGTNSITGFWENGESLEILLRQPSDYDPYTQVILHEIPEPTTFLLFGLGSFFLRKHKKTT